jgi:hypothetical protein
VSGSVVLPAQAGTGTTVVVPPTLESETHKFNVGITFDVVPIGGAVQGPDDVDPSDPSYDEQGLSIWGHVVDVVQPGTTPLEVPVEVPDDLPPGTYVVVVHVNRNDTTPDDDRLQQEDPQDEEDNSLVVNALLTVFLPTNPDLRVVSCAAVGGAVDTTLSEPIFVPSHVPGFPDTAAHGVPVALVIEALSHTVATGVEATFEMFDPASSTWIPLKLATEDGSLLDAWSFPELRVGTTAGVDDPVTDTTRPTARQGATVRAMVPEELLGPDIGTEDVVVLLRTLLDPEDVVTEEGETPGVLQSDNVREFSAVFLQMPPEPDGSLLTAAVDGGSAPAPLVVPASLESTLWSASTPTPLPSRDGGSDVLQFARQTSGHYGNSDFGVGHAFGAGLSWQNSAQSYSYTPRPRSTLFTGYGQVYLELWGNRHTIVDARGGVLNDSCIPALRRGFEIRVLGASLWSSYSSSGATLSTTQSYSREKSVGKTILVGPVPVKVEVGAEGTLGVTASLSLAAGPVITAKVQPFADLIGFAQVSIELIAASGGVTAELRVVRADVAVQATLTLPCPDAGGPRLELTVPWSLRTLDGEIYIWVKYPSPTWSNPGRKKTKTWTLLEWTGFEIASGVLWSYVKTW